MRYRLDQVARVWAIAALVAWVTFLALALGSTSNARAASPSAGTADEPRLEQRRATRQTSVDEVSKDVMCPSCDSTLDQSNSPAAEGMRSWVREAVAAGWTEDEIRDGLVAEYDGDESVLATPRATGLGLAVWIVPALVVLVAAIGGVGVMRGWRRSSAALAGDQTRSGSSSKSHSSASTSSGSSPAGPSSPPPSR